MASYTATLKGLVRGAILNIEETLQQHDISDLNQQDRATIETDAHLIINVLGGRAMIEPEHKSLLEALSNINAILDMADSEQRELNTLERDIVIDIAQSLLLL